MAASNQWRIVKKLVDEAKVSNIVLANDIILQVPLLANTKYHIKCKIYYDATVAVSGIKWRHTGPALPTLVRIYRYMLPGSAIAYTNILTDIAYSVADITSVVGTSGGYIELSAIIHNGVNAGVFAFQWAQQVTNVGALTIRAGSFMEVQIIQ